MAINKVVDRNGNTVIDLTNDNITVDDVKEGVRFHGNDGEIYYGRTKFEYKKKTIKFIDDNGLLMYEYTPEEINNLTELPSLPDIPEGALFMEWNWSLEDLQTMDWENVNEYPVVGCYPVVDKTIYNFSRGTGTPPNTITLYINFYNSNGDYYYAYFKQGQLAKILSTDNSLELPINVSTSSYQSLSYSVNFEEIENKDIYIEFDFEKFLEDSRNNFAENPLFIRVHYSYGATLNVKQLFNACDYTYNNITLCGSKKTVTNSSIPKERRFIIMPKGATTLAQGTELYEIDFVSQPRRASANGTYIYPVNSCPGSGFIPEILSGNVYVEGLTLFDGDVLDINYENAYIFSNYNPSMAWMFFKNPINPSYKKVKLKSTASNSSYSSFIYENNGMPYMNYRSIEEIDIDLPWIDICRWDSYSNARAIYFDKLKLLKISQPKSNKFTYPIFSCYYLRMSSAPKLTIDLTRWKELPTYNGKATYDPIFGINNLNTLNGHGEELPEVLVRESLLNQLKSTTPWNIISDFYVGVPDEEIED